MDFLTLPLDGEVVLVVFLFPHALTTGIGEIPAEGTFF